MNLKVTAIEYMDPRLWVLSRIGSMGVVFNQSKTVLLNCRTVFVACGLTKSSVLFLQHPDQSYILLHFSKIIFTYNFTILAQYYKITL